MTDSLREAFGEIGCMLVLVVILVVCSWLFKFASWLAEGTVNAAHDAVGWERVPAGGGTPFNILGCAVFLGVFGLAGWIVFKLWLDSSNREGD